MPQLRQNIITGEWVVFAPERAKRPTDYISVATEKKQKKEDCPFCIDSDVSEFPSRIKVYDQSATYLIKNKYPAFVEEPEIKNAKLYRLEDEFYKMKLALGGHDVVVCKDHDVDLPHFKKKVFEDLFLTFKKRSEDYAKIENIESIMPIYNHGVRAAASIEHPHAQIIASAIVPNSVSRELTYTGSYFSQKKSCAFCDLIEHERDQNTRLIFENDDFVAFTFYAARFPFEIWVLPKAHKGSFVDITSREIENLAQISKDIFSRLGDTLKDPDLNFFIHSSPVGEEKTKSYHYHMEITPRLSTYGGYELGSGMIIDIIAPEQAADYLRVGKK